MAYSTLIVDDQQAFTELFCSSLQNIDTNCVVTECFNLQCAFDILFETKNETLYDVVILDHNMPACLCKNIKNGTDLAKMIRAKFSKHQNYNDGRHLGANSFEKRFATYQPQGHITQM